MHAHPAAGPLTNFSPLPETKPVAVIAEVLENQDALLVMPPYVITPFELNCPWARRKNFELTSTLTGVGWEQGPVLSPPFEQIRTAMSVTGVEVGTGVVVVLVLPQLKIIAAITNPSTGTIIRHLFRHIEHQAMARQLKPCQGSCRK